MKAKFHLAFASSNLMKAKEFYGGLLRCESGREASNWIDYNFFGHQLTIQYVSSKSIQYPNYHHPSSGIPLNHWGLILDWGDWHTLKDKLLAEEIDFVIEPQIVMEGEVGEQHSLMLRDPDGNVLEFKTFEDPAAIFRKSEH